MRKRRDNRLRYTAVAGIIVVALALLAVPTTALGAKPIRTVTEPKGFVAPAGTYCSFGVEGQPDENARRTITQFSDGRIQTIGHAQTTLTNRATGDSFVQVSRYKETQTFDPEANEVLVETSGRFFIGFEEWEADKGPLGEVGEDGMLASVIGHEQYTLHPDTGVITSYSLDGRATDICALLSG